MPAEMFSDLDLAPLRALLQAPKKITIITHFNPDGDALGSSLGLQHYLLATGHEVTAILPSASPPYYHWMPGFDSLHVFQEKDRAIYEGYLESSDLIFCLDFNHSSRVNVLSETLSRTIVPKILIDHHEEPSDEFQYVFSYPDMSSTAELIYMFIKKIHGLDAVTTDIATCLYTGLITDTGGFQFSSTHASTHEMAARLIDTSISPSDIYNACFNNFSLNRLKLFGFCIAENMKIFADKKLAIMWIDKKTKRKFDIQDGDTEGLVNYPLKVEDIQASILFKEDYDKIRISFRSKKDVDVNQIARKFFNGGGHKNAAGGMSKLNLTETLAYFESIVDQAF